MIMLQQNHHPQVNITSHTCFIPHHYCSGEMSFLALWNLQADTRASKKHDEFAGRLKYGNKAELYQKSQPRLVW